MAFEQVVITLTPVYSPDTLPFRSLTFSSDSDTIPIGRASKSEVKNLLPEHDNGWFNSRVMSRNHAVLSVRMEKKAVYVRDHGSLHGTQLNDIKITPKENVVVNSGDVLTFGSEISRGAETFRPIAVRLDCQWHESKEADPKDTSKPAPNTFSVPEDDDDVVVIAESRKVSGQQHTPQNLSDSSDVDYGSDMSRPLDLTSPVTSPEVKTSELLKYNTLKEVGETQHQSESHLELPKFVSSESLQNEDLDSEEDASDSDSEGSADDNLMVQPYSDDDDDLESDESEDEHDEANDLPEQQLPRYKVLKASYDPRLDEEMDYPDPPPEMMISDPVPSSAQNDPKCDEEQDFPPPPPEYLISDSENIREPASSLQEQKRPRVVVLKPFNGSRRDEEQDFPPPPPELMTTDPISSSAQPVFPANIPRLPVGWPEYLAQRVPSPSDKAMAKPMATLTPNYQSYDYPSSFDVWSNNHGPSQPAYQDPVNLANPYGSITANESFPFGPHRSSGYLRHLAGDLLGEGQAPMSNEKPFESISLRPSRSNGENSAASKEAEKATETPKTRLSIADIVEKSATVSNERKRKADTLDHTVNSFFGESKETGSSQESIPDAQPRPDLEDIQPSDLQTLEVDTTNEIPPKPTEEHRPKRVKTREAHNFMKYATFAAIGAVVGSIGTIAGLASLPADFFN